ARQWLLLSRREAFEPGNPHRLWLTVGGRCGQSGIWALDVAEGHLDEQFQGRIWTPTPQPYSEAREQQKRAREEEKSGEQDRKFLEALDTIDPAGKGVSIRQVREQAGVSGAVANATVTRLVRAGLVVEIPDFTVRAGNGAANKAKGVRRA